MPGYVILTSGSYAEDALVPVALEGAPLDPAGAFLCADIVGVSLPDAVAAQTTLTKYQFRKRFTDAEKYRCDAFNATFESNPNLTDEAKAAIRSGLEDYRASQEISLLEPGVHAMLLMYEQLGLLDAPGRAQQIGAIE